MATSAMILADTNILIELFKGNQTVLADLQHIGPNNIAISAVTVMELYCAMLFINWNYNVFIQTDAPAAPDAVQSPPGPAGLICRQ